MMHLCGKKETKIRYDSGAGKRRKRHREVRKLDKGQRQYQLKREIPRRTGRAHRNQNRLSVFFMVICLLLILNIFFSFYLLKQIGSIRNTLEEVLRNENSGQDTDSQVISGRVQNQQASPEGSQVSYLPQVRNTPAPVSEEEGEDYVELCGLPEVDKPVQRSRREALKRLEELAEDSKLISEILENPALYPDKMLEALANNPEMADYVAGYPEMAEKPSEDRKSGGGITGREKEQEYPLFLQWDPRWGYMPYGQYSNVGLAGCGPTCLSMVMYYLLENEELTPDVIAAYSEDNGYYVWGAGTAWALLEDYPAMYGLSVRQPGKSEETLKAALDQERLVICSMGPGDFTAGGHFIVIYGYDDKGFKVNDPNCVARSRKQWTYEEIGWQIKQIWTYGPGGEEGTIITNRDDGIQERNNGSTNPIRDGNGGETDKTPGENDGEADGTPGENDGEADGTPDEDNDVDGAPEEDSTDNDNGAGSVSGGNYAGSE